MIYGIGWHSLIRTREATPSGVTGSIWTGIQETVVRAGATEWVYIGSSSRGHPMASTPLDPSTMLELAQASEIRNRDGGRRYGSVDTLRRRIKSGDLPYEMSNNKYLVKVADLDAMRQASRAERAFAELKAAAEKAAIAAPPISPERRDLIVSILRGAAA